jgi:DNA-binding response OmpR family regulator
MAPDRKPLTTVENRMARVLLVNDHTGERATLSGLLRTAGFSVTAVGTALEGLRLVSSASPDLVVLGLGLPDLDGVAALRMMRSVCDAPIVVLIPRSGEPAIVEVFDAGADDSIVTPFSGDHLVARMRALLRRVRRLPTATPLVVGELRIDLLGRETRLGAQRLALSRKEFDLLTYLAERCGRVVSRRDLLTNVWHRHGADNDATVDVHVSWLRRKLGETAAHPRYLHTVRGVGHKLVAPR